MARSNGYAITGNELQAMVNEHILGAKGAIPATDRCLSNAEVYNGVYVYLGDAPSGTWLPFHTLSNVNGLITTGASPNWIANYTNINPIQATGSIYFEMNQEGNPYLNCDLFGYVNGSPLRLDPGSSLDGMFFGGPQYSANMASAVRVGNEISVQANFGRNDQETAGNWGWNGPGYGFLQVFANGALIHDYSVFKNASYSANLVSHGYTFTVAAGTNYYIKAWSLVAYSYSMCYSSVSASNACLEIHNNITGQCACCGGSGC